MSQRIQTLLVWIAAIAILAGGYVSMELVGMAAPVELNRIKSVPMEQQASALYVDGQEELIFYPWTTYRPEEAVSVQFLVAQNNGDYKASRDELHSLLDMAAGALSNQYLPTADFVSAMVFQESTQKIYLPPTPYTGKHGEKFTLQAVWDGMRFEMLHIVPVNSSSPLTNDERQARIRELDTAIRKSRGAAFPHEGEVDTTEIFWDDWVETAPENASTNDLLEQFMKIYATCSSTQEHYPLIYNLLYEGTYHAVFYKGEILLFFLPYQYDTNLSLTYSDTTGLLLYIDQQENTMRGFSLINLNA